MATLLTRLGNYFKLGKGRYFVGKDLESNKYYEFPALDGSLDPRKTRRLVQYREEKELGEHDQGALPIQWLMWLRHTRRSAPTIDEIRQDLERIRITQHNAKVLEARDAERKLQLESKAAADAQRMRIEADSSRSQGRANVAGQAPQQDPRRTTVPTSQVSDKEADAESKDRVSEEKQLDETTMMQQRKIDMEVWEASRRRIEEQDRERREQLQTSDAASDGQPSMREARDRRSARRAEMDKREQERERARRFMMQSPLSAFDVSFGGPQGTARPQQPQQQQPPRTASRPIPARPGRATGPGEDWAPQSWTPQPRERK